MGGKGGEGKEGGKGGLIDRKKGRKEKKIGGGGGGRAGGFLSTCENVQNPPPPLPSTYPLTFSPSASIPRAFFLFHKLKNFTSLSTPPPHPCAQNSTAHFSPQRALGNVKECAGIARLRRFCKIYIPRKNKNKNNILLPRGRKKIPSIVSVICPPSSNRAFPPSALIFLNYSSTATVFPTANYSRQFFFPPKNKTSPSRKKKKKIQAKSHPPPPPG